MCFSASASFGAGAILTVAGIVTTRRAGAGPLLAFASIPFLFSIQQFAEGFSWLGLSGHGYPWQHVPAYIFLFFSHVAWPVWMPFSLLIIEPDAGRRKILYSLLLAGCILAAYHLYYMIAFGVDGAVVSCHIDYATHFPRQFEAGASLLYGLTTVIPFIVSGLRRMWIFAVVLLLSYIVSKIFYEEYLVSVFCFFAAILSVVIYYILPGPDDPNAP